MGCERRVVYDFVNVINGEATLKQALIKDKRFENLFVLAASQTRDKDALTKEGVERVLDELRETASTTSSATRRPASRRVRSWRCTLPTAPWWWSIRKCQRCATRTASSACWRARPDTPKLGRGARQATPAADPLQPGPRRESGDMMSIADVQEILGIEVVGVIPESEGVLAASNAGVPVILDESRRRPGLRRCRRPPARRDRALRFTEAQKKGFFSRMFGG
jgi:septum site-determining protein MinD